MRYISKSKYLSGLQCPKLLWVNFNDRTRMPPPDAATQTTFDQGHQVGEYAKRLFPTGIEVGAGLMREFNEIFERTREGLASRLPLFEAALSHDNAYARVDILDPVGDDEWDIVEVKSATEPKDVNIDDIAFQRYVFEGAGVGIRNCYLLHINKEYIRNGEIDPQGLFTKVDVTDLVAERLPLIGAELQEMIRVIEAMEEPEVGIGAHCDDPYTCTLHDYCWADVPEDSVFSLYNIRKKKAFELFEGGIKDIVSIPASQRLTANQQIQRDAIVSGIERIDKNRIKEFLRSLIYPLYYLDFETINPAVPVYDGTRPYQQIGFQFSLQIQDRPDAELVHHMYLAEGTADPRPEFMRLLHELLGVCGSIVTYNASFEKRVLRECVEAMPQYAKWYAEIEARIADLLIPFRSFDFYHPAQHGSASIKKVLPVLSDMRYDGEIADGATASNEYLRVTFGDVDAEDRLRVRSALEAYCGLDTLAMVRIADRLRGVVVI